MGKTEQGLDSLLADDSHHPRTYALGSRTAFFGRPDLKAKLVKLASSTSNLREFTDELVTSSTNPLSARLESATGITKLVWEVVEVLESPGNEYLIDVIENIRPSARIAREDKTCPVVASITSDALLYAKSALEWPAISDEGERHLRQGFLAAARIADPCPEKDPRLLRKLSNAMNVTSAYMSDAWMNNDLEAEQTFGALYDVFDAAFHQDRPSSEVFRALLHDYYADTGREEDYEMICASMRDRFTQRLGSLPVR